VGFDRSHFDDSCIYSCTAVQLYKAWQFCRSLAVSPSFAVRRPADPADLSDLDFWLCTCCRSRIREKMKYLGFYLYGTLLLRSAHSKHRVIIVDGWLSFYTAVCCSYTVPLPWVTEIYPPRPPLGAPLAREVVVRV